MQTCLIRQVQIDQNFLYKIKKGGQPMKRKFATFMVMLLAFALLISTTANTVSAETVMAVQQHW